MMRRQWLVVALMVLVSLAAPGMAQTKAAAPRGELLYSTHCIGCHNAQLHWRDQKAANNWDSLMAEVDRWQKNAGLGWRDEDVTEVARYLNVRYYRFPEPRAAGGLAVQAGAAAAPR
ncbi:MAG: cytochrome C [Polaromonas sp.]|uniref:cytochrome C n=1 Tax=Polaromonas sp. TaxID=1869339 RepID=UPI004035DF04